MGVAVPSRSLGAVSAALQSVFIDFDGTSTADNSFSERVLQACQRTCSCDCSAPTGERSLAASLNTSITNAELVTAFGGEAQLARLHTLFHAIRSQGVRLTLISTSWDQVGAEAWANYLQTVSRRVGLGFVAADGSAGNGSDADFHRLQQRQQQEGSATIIALADPGPGMSADKGAAIGASLDYWNISGSTALLIDDSDGNIHSAAKVCDTLWLPQRAGMSADAVNYVMARLDHRVGGGTEGGGHAARVAPVLLIGLLSLCLLAMVAALCTMRWRPSSQSLQYQHLRQQEANPANSQTIK